MAKPFDTAHFYKNDAFSDITIKFGEHEFPAHRMILCSQSEYFNRAIGLESKFKESLDGELELKEDDADAVEGMLRYLYTSTYLDNVIANAVAAEYHLNVAIVADKYGLEPLRSLASNNFRAQFAHTIQTKGAIATIILSRKFPDCDDQVRVVYTQFVDRHFVDLFRLPAFRDILEEDEDIKHRGCKMHLKALMKADGFREMLQNDGKLAVKLLEPLSFFHDVVERRVFTCPKCNRVEFFQANIVIDGSTRCSKCSRIYAPYSQEPQLPTKCWVLEQPDSTTSSIHRW